MIFVTSLVSFDVVLVVCAHFERNEQLTMKRLNSSLRYSVSHVRRTVRSLESEGMLECRPNPMDGRNALVSPTPLLLELMDRLGEATETTYCQKMAAAVRSEGAGARL